MSAIITPTFRRNSVSDFQAGVDLGTNNYYIGIGRLIPWDNNPGAQGQDPIGEESSLFVEPLPQVTLNEEKDVRDELMTLVKVDPTEVKAMIPKNQWASTRKYKRYDPTDPLTFEYEGEIYPCVAVNNNRIYLCVANGAQNLAAGLNGTPADSLRAPDHDNITFQNNGVGGQDANRVGLPDDNGYMWAYLGDLSSSGNLDNDQFVGVPDVLIDSAGNANRATAAEQATGGLVYGFKVIEGGNSLNLTGANAVDLVLEGVGKDGTAKTNVDIIIDGQVQSPFVVNGLTTGNVINEVKYVGSLRTAPLGFAKASVCAYTNKNDHTTKLDNVKIIPLIAPIEGFGYDVRTTSPSHYVGLYTRFAEGVDGEALTDVAYRQISIIKNPQRRDDSPRYTLNDDVENDELTMQYENEAALDCLNYIQVKPEVTLSDRTAGTIMTQLDVNSAPKARASIVHVDVGNGKIYFQQSDYHTGNFLPFNAAEVISIPNVGGEPSIIQAGQISEVVDSEYIHDTGEVLFVDNRKRINRNADQIEDLRIIIQF